MEKDKKEIPDYLLKLIEGCSAYNKVAIQFWLAIAFFSILSISPAKADTNGNIKMPFDLKDLQENEFYPFTFVIIAILIIGFGSAICQAIRTRKLIQRAINELKDGYIFQKNIYLQDIVDAIIHPALNRVAPWAQVLHGKKQFFPEAYQVKKIDRLLVTIYYILLKMAATVVMYILPGYALLKSANSMVNNEDGLWGIPLIIFWIIGIIAAGILFEMFVLDIDYAAGVFKRINRREKMKTGNRNR